MYDIIGKVGIAAVFEQCAEELSELTQALLKMARVVRGENPTPITPERSFENMVEELADVRLCLRIIDQEYCGIDTSDIEQKKLVRWIRRIENATDNKEEYR